jgi:N-acyl-phosphatidylethanolamine-hydrolysing phospholipase D
MSSATTAAVLYASVISPSQLLGAEPEDNKELKHHLKGGGFTNPWDSFLDMSGWQIASAMLM